MRKISANYVFPVSGEPIKNGIVCIDNNNVIIDVISPGDSFREVQNLERYSGIITPGFVNAHCHLELSHLKGVIKKETGMAGFIADIGNLRNNYSQDDIQRSIKRADSLMQSRGIVVVGDIVNSSDTISVKKQSSIYYHSFVELFGLNPENVDSIISKGNNLKSELSNALLDSSIVPHSPYSVSSALFNRIKILSSDESIYSIHIKESNYEEQFFHTNDGQLFDLCKNIYSDLESVIKPNSDSLDFASEYFPKTKILLVHCVFLTSEKLYQLIEKFKTNDIFIVLCPLSNKYINNSLPNLPDLYSATSNICIGTDSLASNNDLSILSELIELKNTFNDISLVDLIKFATLNGARALGISSTFGSIEIGKRPGLNLIQGLDLINFNFSSTSKVTPLIKM